MDKIDNMDNFGKMDKIDKIENMHKKIENMDKNDFVYLFPSLRNEALHPEHDPP